eukprot:6263601-Ditylum_brightwellii.AAC.1
MEMVCKDQGQQTSWDNKCNESDIKGEKQAEYYAAKKIRNGEKTLFATNNGIGKETASSIESGRTKQTNAPIVETGWRKRNDGAPQLGSVQVHMDTGIAKTNKYDHGSNMDKIKEQGAKAIDATNFFSTAPAIDL